MPHPDHDRGLEFDLSTMMSRRSLGMFFGAGGPLRRWLPARPAGRRLHGQHLGVDRYRHGTPSATATATASPSATPTLTRAIAECGVEIPQETAGPYPG